MANSLDAATGRGIFQTSLLAAVLVTSLHYVTTEDRRGTVDPGKAFTAVKGRLQLSLRDDAAPVEPADRAISSCLAYLPKSKEPVAVTEKGSTDPRISLLGNFTAGDCGLRVQPVIRDSDEGEWRLRMVYKKDAVGVMGKSQVTVSEYSGGVGPDDLPSVNEGSPLDLVLYPSIRPATATSNWLQFNAKTHSGIMNHITSKLNGDIANNLPDAALSWCMAVMPSGKEVTVAPNITDPRIVYIQDKKSEQTLEAGWCGVRITEAMSQDHGLWVLEAADQATGVVFRGKATVNVWVPKMRAAPEAITAQIEDEAVIRMLQPKTRPWTLCQVQGPTETLYHLAGEPKGKAVVDPRVQYAGDSLPKGDCGMKLRLGSNSNGTWTLVATRAGGSVGKASAKVTALGPYQPSRRTLTATLGRRNQQMSCGPAAAVSCRLTDPTGEETLFIGPCTYTIDNVRNKHAGTWTCTASVPGYLLEIQDSFNLKLIEDVHTELDVTWREDSVQMSCRVRGTLRGMAKPSWCRLEQPGGAVVLLQDGVLSNTRFRYAGTGFDSFDCSMTISRPLNDNDTGVWRCTMGTGVIPLRGAGGLISLFPEGAKIPPPHTEPLRTPLSGSVRNGSAMSVGCRADRPLAYCWLRSPAGEVLMLHDSYVNGPYRSGGAGLRLGECVVDVKPAESAKHSGAWTCGMGIAGQLDSAPDLQLAVTMHVSDSLLKAHSDSVPASRGSWATLGCITVTAESITYCRFQRPDGLSIHVADDTHEEPRSGSAEDEAEYEYSGTGLHNGSCGLLIRSVRAEDFGTWTCSVGLSGDINGREQSAAVNLVPEASGGLAAASVVGLAVGLVLVGLLAGAVAGYRYFVFRQNRYQGCELLDVTAASASFRRSPPPSPITSSDSPTFAVSSSLEVQSRRRSRQGDPPQS